MNKKNKSTNIQDITIIDGGRQLASRNNHGITIWRLNKGYRQFIDPTPEPDLCESQVVLLPDKKHMVIVKDESWLLKVDLENKMKVIKKINLPGPNENLILKSKLTGNGDLLLYWQEIPASKKTLKEIFSTSEVDLGVLEQINGTSSFYRLDLILLDRLGETQDINNVQDWLQQIEWNRDFEDPGFHNLYRGLHPLTVFNCICRVRSIKKNLSNFPIFENGKTIFLESHCDDPSENELIVYLGTLNGRCEEVRMNIRHNVKKCKSTLCEAGQPIFQKMFQQYQRTVNFVSDFTSNPDLDITMSENSVDKSNLGLSSRKNDQIVNDCKRFVRKKCEVIIMTEVRDSLKGRKKRYCVVYMKTLNSSQWVSAKCGVGNFIEEINEEEFFRIHSMGEKYEKGDLIFQFYMISTLGIVLLRFSNNKESLQITRFLKKRIKTNVGVVHSQKSKYFYIPTRNVIQVWRENLSNHAFSISLELDIHHICQGQGDNLLVIDKSNYYEISTQSMETRKIYNLLPNLGQSSNPRMVLNVDVFPRAEPINLPEMEVRIPVMNIITDIDMLNLNEFPFESLGKCFEEESLQDSIMRVADYYFKKIRQTNAEDYIYGPFNPLLIAVYHNQTDLLKNLLEKHFYPQSTKNYLSPLTFSFLCSYHSAVKVICDYLIRTRQPVKFSRLDFQYLLRSPFSYCHKLLAFIPQEPSLKNTRRFLSLEKDIKLFFAQNDSDLSKQVDAIEESHEQRRSKKQLSLLKKMETFRKNNLINQRETIIKRPTLFDNFEKNLQHIKTKKEIKNEKIRQSMGLIVPQIKITKAQPGLSEYFESGNLLNSSQGSNNKKRNSKISSIPESANLDDYSSYTNNPFNTVNIKKKRSSQKPIKNKYLLRNWDTAMTFQSLIEPQKKRSNNNGVSIKEIRTVQVPFKYSFHIGTPDSVDFLKSYSDCKTEEFVTSDWQEVVKYKWQKYKPFHIILALLYWSFTILVTIAIIFYPNVKALQQLSVSFAVFFLIYEIFELVAYCCFDIWSYFGDPWNTVDWCTFFGVLIYFFGFHHDPMKPASKLLSTVSLIIVFYRSFSYLRIINSFTTLVRMINIIISKLTVFFLILLYFYCATTFLLANLDTKSTNKNSFTYTYALTLFGAIANDHFFKFNYAALGIIFGTLSVTILLMNILIAFLSNAFSRLEEQQHVNGLKEKASMILDFEVLIRFFKYYIPGAIKKFYKEELLMQQNLFQLNYKTHSHNMFKITHNTRKHKHVLQLENMREFLFIFKSVDFEEKETQEDIDQNIYKRVKVLNKSVGNLQEMLGALYEKKFGVDFQENKKNLSRIKNSKI